ncbi:MAG: fused uroporphyrinogen-III synthase HemD/membrane protein HemX [Candidatus Protistobacter heckmanni]|nr:fused uroporphyrinogen-III synthase HemD/membrane protein HemX [Candidatus Protistobacter heckmanni]
MPATDPDAPIAPIAIVTRPAGLAGGLEAALRERGLDTLRFPLIDILPPEDPSRLDAALAELTGEAGAYALAIFVSPSAIDSAFGRLPGVGWPRATAIGVISPGSVAALAAHGVRAPEHRILSPKAGGDGSSAENERYDSEALLAELRAAGFDAAGLSGKRVLLVRGNGGRELLADSLRQAGAVVTVVEAYRRAAPLPGAQAWAQLARALARPHVWLLTSSEAARNLVKLGAAAGAPAALRSLAADTAIAPHPRIVDAARELGFGKLVLSGSGDDNLANAAQQWAMSDNNKPQDDQAAASPARDAGEARPARDLRSRIGGIGAGMNAGHWRLLLAGAVVLLFGVLQLQVYILSVELSARAHDNDIVSREAALRIQSGMGDLQGKLGAAESRIAEMRDKQADLDQLYADYGPNGFLLAEIEQSLAGAAQQLQLTGNVASTLAILQQADMRAARADRQQFAPLRRALAADMDKLKAWPRLDLAGASILIEQALAAVDTLPMNAGEKLAPPAKPAAPAKSAAKNAPPWWEKLAVDAWQSIKDETERLVQVRRVDQPAALLGGADQAGFIRASLKLRLLGARVSLLSRNPAALRNDLAAAQSLLADYFDAGAGSVQSVRSLIKQGETMAPSLVLPELSSLAVAQRLRAQ